MTLFPFISLLLSFFSLCSLLCVIFQLGLGFCGAHMRRLEHHRRARGVVRSLVAIPSYLSLLHRAATCTRLAWLGRAIVFFFTAEYYFSLHVSKHNTTSMAFQCGKNLCLSALFSVFSGLTASGLNGGLMPWFIPVPETPRSYQTHNPIARRLVQLLCLSFRAMVFGVAVDERRGNISQKQDTVHQIDVARPACPKSNRQDLYQVAVTST